MSEKYQNLEQALRVKVPTEKGKDLPVSKIIDVEQIALAIEEKAGAKNLGAVLANLEKNIFAGGEISDKIKEPNKTKLRQGIAKALETVFNSLEFFEEQVIEGSLMGEFPVGVMGKNPSAEDVSNAVEVIRNLIVSYIEAIKEFYDASELTTEQQQLFGLVEDKADAKEADPADLVEFAEEVAAIEQRLTTENDLDGDFFDPREEYKDKQSYINYLNNRVKYFNQIYSLGSQSNPTERVRIIGLIDKYIGSAELLINRLNEWVEAIEDQNFEEWKKHNQKYKKLDKELKKYEESKAGIALDGSVDLSTNLLNLVNLIRELDESIESTEYAAKRDLFDGIFARATNVQADLQVIQYRFLVKDLVAIIKKAEGLNPIPEGRKKSLSTDLENARHVGEEDLLSNTYFSRNVSEVYGVNVAAQDRVGDISIEIKERYQRIFDKVRDRDNDTLAEEYRKKDLSSLVREYHTNDVSPEQRPTYYKVLEEKLFELKEEFIEFSLKHDNLDELGNELPPEKALERAEAKYQAYVDLVRNSAYLVEFGIFKGSGLNTLQGTAKHEAILKSSDTNKAMATNINFNNNPLVGSVGEWLDQGEMFLDARNVRKKDATDLRPTEMGIVQLVTFAVYQEMKSKRKLFTRNQGYDATQLANLIEAVCQRQDIYMWQDWQDPNKKAKILTKEEAERDYVGLVEGDKKPLLFSEYPGGEQVNVQAELAKFDPETVQMIKQIALWKICRDDLGSKAGIWHWGHNKGAFKFSDGAKGMPTGIMAGQCYQVGKNSKFQGHLAAFGFLTPQRTEYMIQGGKKREDDISNDADILFGINKVDRYLMYLHPQLKSGYYGSFNPEEQVYDCESKHQPENWWEDFPGLDHFFNKTDKVFTGGDYIKSRDSIQKIIELATESLLIKLPLDMKGIEDSIKASLQVFMTEIGKAMAYMGAYEKGNELNYVHELIIAAFKFYIMNILTNVPQLKEMPLSERALSGFRDRGKDTVVSEFADPDYYARFRRAKQTIKEVIIKNGTLAKYWSVLVAGSDSFIEKYDFRNVWRDQSRISNDFTTWLVDEMNKQSIRHAEHNEKEAAKEEGRPPKKLSSRQIRDAKMRLKDEISIKENGPEEPYVIKGGEVWSIQSSHE